MDDAKLKHVVKLRFGNVEAFRKAACSSCHRRSSRGDVMSHRVLNWMVVGTGLGYSMELLEYGIKG